MEESGKECEGECEVRCENKSKRDLEQYKERMIKDEVVDQDHKNNNSRNVGGSSDLVKEVENHGDFVKDSNKESEKEQVVSNKEGIDEKSNIDSKSSLPQLKKDDSNQNLLAEINTDLGSQNQAQIIPKSCVEPVVQLGKEQRDKKEATEKCEIGELPTNKEDALHVILRVDRNKNNDEPLEELRGKDIQQATHDVSNGKYVSALKDEASKVQNPVPNEDLIIDEDKESETASFGTDETATIADDEFYSLCLPHDDYPHLSNEASREISPLPQKTQTEKGTSRDTQGTTASKSITNTDVTSKDDNTVYLCSAKVRKEGLDPDCQVILKNNEVMIGNCDDVTFTSPGHSVTSQQEKPSDQNESDDEDDSAFHNAISDVDKNSRVRKEINYELFCESLSLK
ncbi:hypothetical protein LSTR_LSTR012800 [Laodelphax striatellus]|uniref:Uncharacterized protein n=1 Tax=Laodelphax striatellus TaxID=195883 RepID=A0A482WSC6_LAOST|nr:hypothetical protein LSTR_LSTR012800 [Laodelphax striatellus]